MEGKSVDITFSASVASVLHQMEQDGLLVKREYPGEVKWSLTGKRPPMPQAGIDVTDLVF